MESSGLEETFDEPWGYFTKEQKLARKREYRRNHKTDYRKFNWNVPTRGKPFAIVPEVSPILKELADLCGREAGFEEGNGVKGITVLAARAAVVMGQKTDSIHRRLYSIINNKQLFVSADFVECCLMALDAEHDYHYGEWPARRGAALERITIEAEISGKKMSQRKQLAKANRLYEKGVRKALKRAVEVNV